PTSNHSTPHTFPTRRSSDLSIPDMAATPTASYSITVRAKIPDQPGMFAKIAAAIGEAGGSLGGIDLVDVRKGVKIRDITIAAAEDRKSTRLNSSHGSISYAV